MRMGLGLGLQMGQPLGRKKMDTKYLFIDGGCLRATIKKISERYFDGAELKIDYVRLSGGYKKAFYYDAIPAIKRDENDLDYAQRIRSRVELHNHIATLPGYHVYEGDSRIRRKQVQQKEVDVMIAVDMLTHTFRGNMDRATLIASDLDFKPLLDALVREGMFVELRYPPLETNQDLINAADHRIPLAIDTVYAILSQDSQDLLALPTRRQCTKKGYDHSTSIIVQNHPSLGEVRYKYYENRHYVYWSYPENIDNFIEVVCKNYILLHKYLEDVFVISMPLEPVQDPSFNDA